MKQDIAGKWFRGEATGSVQEEDDLLRKAKIKRAISLRSAVGANLRDMSMAEWLWEDI